MIKLYFPVCPTAKARPRVTRTGHCYTPKKTKDFEIEIKHLANLQYKDKPLTGVLSVRGYFFVKKPKRTKNPYPIARPDIDNFLKGVLDALNGVIWEDDSQICSISIAKVYADVPSITISVEEGFVF